MTNITQLVKQCRLTCKAGELSEFENVIPLNDLAKLEQLLRDKFIAELGEPKAWMHREYTNEVSFVRWSDDCKPLYALKDER